MLALKRRQGQSIVIGGGEIIVTVVEIGPGYVKLGVTAPRQVTVHRGEVQDRIDGRTVRTPTGDVPAE